MSNFFEISILVLTSNPNYLLLIRSILRILFLVLILFLEVFHILVDHKIFWCIDVISWSSFNILLNNFKTSSNLWSKRRATWGFWYGWPFSGHQKKILDLGGSAKIVKKLSSKNLSSKVIFWKCINCKLSKGIILHEEWNNFRSRVLITST